VLDATVTVTGRSGHRRLAVFLAEAEATTLDMAGGMRWRPAGRVSCRDGGAAERDALESPSLAKHALAGRRR